MIIIILKSAALLGSIGLLTAIILGLAGVKLAVKSDELENKIRKQLPGFNCGACGYAGCDALAKAIASGVAPHDACKVGGKEVAKKLGDIMNRKE